MSGSLRLRAALVSFAILATFLLAWHLAVQGGGGGAAVDPEYAKLVGAAAAGQAKSAMPGPLEVGAKIWSHLMRPFYDNGPQY